MYMWQSIMHLLRKIFYSYSYNVYHFNFTRDSLLLVHDHALFFCVNICAFAYFKEDKNVVVFLDECNVKCPLYWGHFE